ncbi:MAG TPA: type II secretion system protein [Thermoanaerobaculia bacterium]|nr:type II secretion system protein [Thermoanaerobaculia bacterium]
MVNRTRRKERGFTLIELLVVVTIIGLLAGAAVVNVRNARRKANEAVLKKDLHDMREAIDNFYADKQRYPADLNELVPHYLRAIPKDPITNTPDWAPLMETIDPDAPPSTDTSGAPAAPGVVDVKTKAPGTTLDGQAYTDL